MTIAIDDMPEGMRRRFLEDVAAFKCETGIPATTLGETVVGQRGLVSRLKRGKNVSLATIERVESWMDAYREQQAAAYQRQEAQQRAVTEFI